ncbi:MAG: PorV/PorQ family protein [Ignavibacteriae bacterium]|nr:PorV/PorQ family protein [Ignavibacteriota bacterium]
MRYRVSVILLSVIVVHQCVLRNAVYAQLVPNLGGQRAGISAFQFLKIGVGARGVAMGESFVAIANDVSALYWNPAGLVEFKEDQAMASHTEYVVDIKHDFFGVVYHLGEGDAIGASFSSLHMDDMEITTEAQPFGTGRYFSFGDIAIAATYAKRMTDQFSFGATVRYVEETLDVLKMRSVMVDLGTFYWTGLGSTRFAVVITNFGADAKPSGQATLYNGSTEDEFQSFSLPTVFKLGIAMEAFETEDQKLTTSLQLNHPNDNSEHFRLGLEYSFQNTFFVRAGLKRTIGQRLFGTDQTSEEDFALGAGVLVELGITRASADYAFANFNRLGSVHRISLAFSY